VRIVEITGDIWTIPASRYKTKRDHVIPLSKEAKAAIGKLGKPGFVFSSDGGATAINGWSKTKVALDAEIAGIREAAGRKPMEPWTFHDLRRTARSLMSRAGVPADHAERCLGHVIPGVRGVYDRHDYIDEKREAFAKLAAMLDSILRRA
jgi:integrase